MAWTILLGIYLAVALLFNLAGVCMILAGRSGVDLMVGGFIWPYLLVTTVRDRRAAKKRGS